MLTYDIRHLETLPRIEPMKTSAQEARLLRLLEKAGPLICDQARLGAGLSEHLEIAKRHGIDVLVAAAQLRVPDTVTQPEVRDALAQLERRAAILDAIRTSESVRMLNALAQSGVEPLLFKGAALAYQIYAAPHLRPRADVDLLVREADVAHAITVLSHHGYTQTVSASGPPISAQTLLTRIDSRGVGHSIDLHWRPFERSRYRQCFDVDTLLSRSIPLPQLGPSVRCPPLTDALQLACVHLLAHHSQERRLLWLVDIDRLARGLDQTEWEKMEGAIRSRGIETECAAALQMAAELLHTSIVSSTLRDSRVAHVALSRLSKEQSRWYQIWDDFRQLPSWPLRFAYLRVTLFPVRAYMDALYPSRGPLWWRYLRRAILRGAMHSGVHSRQSNNHTPGLAPDPNVRDPKRIQHPPSTKP